jgi:hypothetical protein
MVKLPCPTERGVTHMDDLQDAVAGHPPDSAE